MIEENPTNTQIISLLLCGFDSHDNPQWSYKNGATVMIIAIDDFENSRMSMVFNFNKHVTFVGQNLARFVHNASITVGKRGAVKADEFRSFLKLNYPGLIGPDGLVELGLIDLSFEMTWERDDVRLLLANIVKYILARERFRKEKNLAVKEMGESVTLIDEDEIATVAKPRKRKSSAKGASKKKKVVFFETVRFLVAVEILISCELIYRSGLARMRVS